MVFKWFCSLSVLCCSGWILFTRETKYQNATALNYIFPQLPFFIYFFIGMVVNEQQKYLANATWASLQRPWNNNLGSMNSFIYLNETSIHLHTGKCNTNIYNSFMFHRRKERGNVTVQQNLLNWPDLAVGRYNQIPLVSQAEGAQGFLHMCAHLFCLFSIMAEDISATQWWNLFSELSQQL